jgi:hypothetical protein
MSWKYDKAVRIGETFTVYLKNDDDPENVLSRELTWTYDPDDSMTKKQFTRMIRREVKIWLDHLNREEAEKDVTEELQP